MKEEERLRRLITLGGCDVTVHKRQCHSQNEWANENISSVISSLWPLLGWQFYFWGTRSWSALVKRTKIGCPPSSQSLCKKSPKTKTKNKVCCQQSPTQWKKILSCKLVISSSNSYDILVSDSKLQYLYFKKNYNLFWLNPQYEC